MKRKDRLDKMLRDMKAGIPLVRTPEHDALAQAAVERMAERERLFALMTPAEQAQEKERRIEGMANFICSPMSPLLMDAQELHLWIRGK